MLFFVRYTAAAPTRWWLEMEFSSFSQVELNHSPHSKQAASTSYLSLKIKIDWNLFSTSNNVPCSFLAAAVALLSASALVFSSFPSICYRFLSYSRYTSFCSNLFLAFFFEERRFSRVVGVVANHVTFALWITFTFFCYADEVRIFIWFPRFFVFVCLVHFFHPIVVSSAGGKNWKSLCCVREIRICYACRLSVVIANAEKDVKVTFSTFNTAILLPLTWRRRDPGRYCSVFFLDFCYDLSFNTFNNWGKR